MLEPQIVRTLEKAIETSLADTLARTESLPIAASGPTLHLMAKAAAAVYEAAVENAKPSRPKGPHEHPK